MSTVLLVRHGRSTANTDGVLAGWTPGVHLDDRGTEQANALARRLRPVPLAAVVASPLERCQETASAIADGRDGLSVSTDERLGECKYGDWNGQRLSALAKEELWQVVQGHPSGAVFPGAGGEALRDTQHRAVSAVRAWNDRLPDEATYVVCSHGDVLAAVIADALGMHLDMFQRIQVDPCSLTAIRYTRLRPFLLRLNDTGGSVDDLVPAAPQPKRRWRWLRRDRSPDSSHAVVGGGAGKT